MIDKQRNEVDIETLRHSSNILYLEISELAVMAGPGPGVQRKHSFVSIFIGLSHQWRTSQSIFYNKKESVLTPNHKNIYETKRTFIQMGISLHDNLYSIVLKTNSVNVFSDSDYIINSLLTACVTQLLLFINSDGADG